MKKRVQEMSRRVVLGFCLAFVFPASSMAIDPGQETIPVFDEAFERESRSFVVEMTYQGQNEVTPQSVKVVRGTAPMRLSGPPEYRVNIINLYGRLIESFDTWDPQGISLQDPLVGHRSTSLPEVTASLIFPFSPRAKRLELIDVALGVSVASVDLEPAVKAHCQIHCSEPICEEVVTCGEEPDLAVSLRGPEHAQPGHEIDDLEIVVRNLGGSPAPGTLDADRGYMVDLVLSVDQAYASGFAEFSPTFREDALLAGGRLSRTETLEGGMSQTYPGRVTLPEDVPPGIYCLAAAVDPGDEVKEMNESNNTACWPLYVE